MQGGYAKAGAVGEGGDGRILWCQPVSELRAVQPRG